MNQDQIQTEVAVEQARNWADGLPGIVALIGGRFPRSEPRARAVTYLRGLLSPSDFTTGPCCRWVR